MRVLDGTTYKGRTVRCNDADSRGGSSRDGGTRGGNARGGKRDNGQRDGKRDATRSRKGRDSYGQGDEFARYEKKSKRRNAKNDEPTFRESGRKDDWKQFFQHDNVELRGAEPDFSEEGWARRKPRK